MSWIGDHARELYDEALTWPASPDAQEAALRTDLSLYGVAFVMNGRRVDPRTVHPAPGDGSADA